MSLKYRIALVIFLLEAIMMTIVFSFTLSRTQQVNSRLFSGTENVIVNVLGDLSRVALITLEYGELRPYIALISRDPQVIKVIILNRKGNIVAASDASDIGKPTPVLETSDGTFWRKKTIVGSSRTLGTVLIKFSHENLIQLNKNVITEGVKIALSGMVIIALIGLLTGFLLTRRLAIVSNAAQRISNGELEAKTEMQGSDEVSMLGRIFDEMGDNFKHYIEKLKTGKLELKKSRDELELKVAERTSELEFVALHDSLTQLPNRRLYINRLITAIDFAATEKDHLAVLMIDLNLFKIINDAHGHSTGDSVLVEVARRFKKALRRSDTVARLGGDEFAIVLPGADLDTALNITKNIQNCVAPTALINGHELSLSCSIGIAIFPEHGKDEKSLLQCADIAMYSAKRNKSSHEIYSSDLDTDSVGLLTLTLDLRKAICRNQFELYYQPKFSFVTNELVGAEALLRWNHNNTLIMPDQFIPIAEQTNIINDLSYWVIEQGFKQCLEWNSQGTPISISVNLATKNLEDPDFTKNIGKLIKNSKCTERNLILEITETGIMADPVHSLKVLEELHEMGMGISIDDFGTGHSSLVYLKRFPVDEVKIDRTFILDMLTDNESTVIVRSIIDLAHNLGMSVVAEGVETVTVWNALQNLKCDCCQGYYTGKPMPATEFEKRFIIKNNLKINTKP